MLRRMRSATRGYPGPFWVLFWGMLVNSIGSSMVWPFMTIYMREKFAISLTTVALLLTVNTSLGVVSSFIAGPVVDRLGRKGVMVLSLTAGSATMLGMSLARTLAVWVGLLAAWGAFSPLYRVGGDAMIADMIPSAQRPGAYALLRMSNNLGVAIGPAIGGFVAAVSYAWAFGGACLSQGVFALLVFLGVAETVQPSLDRPTKREGLAGYGLVLRDRPFLGFAGAYALAGMCYSLIWVLLPVYAKDNYGVPESLYGFIPATNAAMVVLLQYSVTRVSSRRRALPVLAVGALFYALGIGSVSLGRGFPFFLGSMVIATIGELIMIPTATAYTADKAPADMRGRYMATYGLTYSLAQGIGPVIAGYLNDHVGPVWIWYAGLAFGMASASGFGLMARASRARGGHAPPTLQPA